ncbi:MAG TPA: DUF1579 family protein [Thermoanaerobaculia bacterium]|nr:DUF1579 family protein [Thermoanaerobaculia bacterium]
MKRALASAICLVVGLGLSTSATAQAAKKQAEKPAAAGSAMSAAAMMKPPAEMGKIQWMLGTWQCTGKAMASPLGPEHPTQAEVKVTLTLNGMWLVAHYREKKTAQNPNPIQGDEYWGYDPAEKMWDRVEVDNTGSFATCSSKGWESGKLVWTCEGMGMGQKMKSTDTFTQKGQVELSLSGEMSGPDGKSAPYAEVSCKK